jgi:hypothetical protein
MKVVPHAAANPMLNSGLAQAETSELKPRGIAVLTPSEGRQPRLSEVINRHNVEERRRSPPPSDVVSL